MVVVSYSGREINAKLVYYGAGLSGKTTNLESIYEAVPETSRGKMVSMKTQSDRTLFFDLLPLDLGEIMGFKTRFLLYTVPGQVFYNATRKLVLKGADAIVFVADSEVGKMDENKESLNNLRANLSEYGLRLEDIPWVIQYNKRDLPEVHTIEELNAELNADGKVPYFEAVATQGRGVFETFRGISHLLMDKVTRELRRAPLASGSRGKSEEAPAPAEPLAMGILDSVGAPTTPVAAEPRPAAPAPPAAADPVTYGRELKLPAEPSPVASARPLPAPAAPAPPGNGNDARISIGSTSPFSGIHDYPERTLSPNDLETRPASPSSFGRDLDLNVPVSPAPAAGSTPAAVTAAPVVATTPERPGMARREAEAPAPAPVAAIAEPAVTAAAEPIVVPVRLPKGTTREIVLRIVISDE